MTDQSKWSESYITDWEEVENIQDSNRSQTKASGQGLKVQIGIPEQTRKEVSHGLAHLLADTYALYLKTQNYHWNVTGAQFFELHRMFQRQYEELGQAVDVIAERIRILGFLAPGGLHSFADLTSIKDGDGSADPKDMQLDLLNGHESAIRRARGILTQFEATHELDRKNIDTVTQGLLIARLEAHEKTAWMLRSCLAESHPAAFKAEGVRLSA